MSLQTPEGLIQSVDNLRGTLVDVLGRLERLDGDVDRLKTFASFHQHDYARDILGKPSTDSVPAHTHPWTTGITGKPTTFAPEAHTHTGYAADTHTHSTGAHTHVWAEITDPPSTYAPSAHNHDGVYSLTSHNHSGVYSLTDHTHAGGGAHQHTTSDITNWPTSFTPSAHTHSWANITDPPATYTPSAHTHDAYAATTHNHNSDYVAIGTYNLHKHSYNDLHFDPSVLGTVAPHSHDLNLTSNDTGTPH